VDQQRRIISRVGDELLRRGQSASDLAPAFGTLGKQGAELKLKGFSSLGTYPEPT
jgi:hypothetical protein